MEGKNLTVPLSIIIAGLIIAGAIVYTQRQKSAELLKEKGATQVVLPEREEISEEILSEEFPSPEQEIQQEFSPPEFTITEKDHVKGNFQAPVTIVVFSDFQCGFCERFHRTLKQVLKDYPDKVRVVFKHFPLDFHPEAQVAAEASECIWEEKGNEGFWQFIDGLFENQEKLGKSLYEELAKKMGVDINRFNECLNSRKHKDKVQADYQEGIKAGVQGTPASFVNGKLMFGALPYENLKKAIEKALGEKL